MARKILVQLQTAAVQLISINQPCAIFERIELRIKSDFVGYLIVVIVEKSSLA